MKKSQLKPNILNIEVLDNDENSPSNVSTSAVHDGYNKEVFFVENLITVSYNLNLKRSERENQLGTGIEIILSSISVGIFRK